MLLVRTRWALTVRWVQNLYNLLGTEGGRELDCCEDPESELDSMLELLAGCWIVDMNFNYDRVAAFYALYALNLPYIKFSRSVLSQDLGEAIAIRMSWYVLVLDDFLLTFSFFSRITSMGFISCQLPFGKTCCFQDNLEIKDVLRISFILFILLPSTIQGISCIMQGLPYRLQSILQSFIIANSLITNRLFTNSPLHSIFSVRVF